MRISELSERSGVPLPTVKYYLREGLLHPGVLQNATRSEYDDSHLRRLALVRTLTEQVGVPVARVKELLVIIEAPPADPYEAVGRAVSQLPPYSTGSATGSPAAEFPLAKAAIERLGWTWDPRFPAVAQLERALQSVAAVGIPMTGKRLRTYGAALRQIAAVEVENGPADPAAYLEYAVLGTALFEPVLVAMRRLAHQDVSAKAAAAAQKAAKPDRTATPAKAGKAAKTAKPKKPRS